MGGTELGAGQSVGFMKLLGLITNVNLNAFDREQSQINCNFSI